MKGWLILATMGVAACLCFAFSIALLTGGCKLGPNQAPVDPSYPDGPPMACPQTRCKPAPAIDMSYPWDAGPDAR